MLQRPWTACNLLTKHATCLLVWVKPVDEVGGAAMPHRGLDRGRRLIGSLCEYRLLPTDCAMSVHLGEDEPKMLLADRKRVVGLVFKDTSLTELTVSNRLIEFQIEQRDRV